MTARRDYAGGAARAQLVADINATSTTITISSASGWPTGSAGEFFVAIDRGNAGEEKVLVLSRSGTTLTLADVTKRGKDGTSAASHTAGVYVEHVHTATDDDEANAHLNNAAGATPHTTAMIADDAITNAKLANMTTDRLKGRDTAGTGDPEDLTVNGGLEFTGSGGIQRSALTGDVTASAGSGATTIAANAVTTTKIIDDAVTAAKIAANAVGASELADNAVDTAAIADDAVTAAKIATDAVGSAEIAANAVGSSELADGSVDTAALIDDSVSAAKIKNEVWDTYTPAITADSGSPIIGNGILSGRYRKQGRTVLVEVSLQLGTTTNFGGGNVYLSLPFTMRTPSPTRQCIGVADLYDSSASTAFAGTVIPVSTWAKVLFYASGSVNPVSGAGSVPFAWATGDVLSFSARFETAS